MRRQPSRMAAASINLRTRSETQATSLAQAPSSKGDLALLGSGIDIKKRGDGDEPPPPLGLTELGREG
jgi:hypothetical protein